MPDDLSDFAMDFVRALTESARDLEEINQTLEEIDESLTGDKEHGLDASDCDVLETTALGGNKTWRCHIFGCKHLSAKDMKRSLRGWCDTHQVAYYRRYDERARDVHVGCCVRCSSPILPRARIER